MIREEVLTRIKPTREEEEAMMSLAEWVMGLVEDAARQSGLDARPVLVGSAARGTWIAGEHDLDMFILFPTSLDVDELREQGLEIAREVARSALYSEERYAEHPYVHALFHSPVGEYDVDLVPCYAVESAAKIRSAVDRTPFHNQFIKAHLGEREDDVRILKQFMKAQGVYGAELRVQGFSGYLTELLVINYGSFEEVLRAAANWHRGETIDIEGHSTREHDDPLVVVDPVDPARNVAAAVSVDQMAIFMDACRGYLHSPSLEWFFPPSVEPLEIEEYRILLKERGTSLVALYFRVPDLVEDILYPQLYKSQRGLEDLLNRENFQVYRSGAWSEVGEAVILFELDIKRLPNVRKHVGPPVFNREHAERFREMHENVFIEEGRYVAEVPRTQVTAAELLEARALSASHGKNIVEALTGGYKVLQDENLVKIRNPGFWLFLRNFFSGLLPLQRP